MSTPAVRPPLRHFTGYPAALILIALFYALALYASTFNSQTFDEGAHLAGGYIHLTLGHPRIHTENGYLSQAIAALPLLLTHPNAPAMSGYAFRHASPFALGQEFLYQSRNNFTQILLLGRAAIGLLTASTALAVYTWSRKLYSPLAGMLSLIVFLLTPLVLAHGFLATSDMAATCCFTLSLAAFTWTLRKITPLRFALCALALAALLLAKMSAPLILPTLALLVLLHLVSPRSPFSVQRSAFSVFLRRLLRDTALILALALTVYALIWSAYGFTYSAFKDSPPDADQTLYPAGQWSWALDKPNAPLHAVAFARDHHLLPESFLYGYAYVIQTGRVVVSFANGAVSATGWWWFYPFVFAITTPLPVLLMLLLAAIRPFVQRRKTRNRPRTRRARRLVLRFCQTAPLTLFILTYFLAAILSYRGSGPRHLLPLYPMLCILLGSLLPQLRSSSSFQHLSFRTYNFLLLPALLLWLAVNNLLIFPHYLSFFNETVGGPRHGYRYLVDSALDWGQDLPTLADILHKSAESPDAAYFSYFGSADPTAYGIHATFLPSFLRLPDDIRTRDAEPLHAGYYCISATMLQNLYNNNTSLAGAYTPEREKDYQNLRHDFEYAKQLAATPDHLSSYDKYRINAAAHLLRNAEFIRLCAYLRHREPYAQAGYSINIYALTTADLDAALNGPPRYDNP